MLESDLCPRIILISSGFVPAIAANEPRVCFNECSDRVQAFQPILDFLSARAYFAIGSSPPGAGSPGGGGFEGAGGPATGSDLELELNGERDGAGAADLVERIEAAIGAAGAQ